MTPDEFTKNEPQIMQQLQMGQIKSQAPDFSAVKNSGRIFTREDIGNMSTDEYKQNEPQIMLSVFRVVRNYKITPVLFM